MSQIKISDLVETTSVDEELCMVPVDDGTATKKISLKNLSASATESAETYALAAAESASSASDSAAAAAQSSSDAGTYATNAAESATDAQGSASSASSSADQAAASASNASASAGNAAASATSVSQQVSIAKASATLARSWAEGGTGARAGEDTNNAKYWAEVAASMHDGVASFNGRGGIVIPASGDYNAGQISYNNSTSKLAATTAQGAIDEYGTTIEGLIAPTENAETMSQGYAIGEEFIRENVKYKAKAAITSGAAWSSLVLDTDYELSADISSQMQTLESLIGTTTVSTLAANATTISFTVPTSGNNLIEFFVSDGSNYTAIDTSVSGTVTLTFEASASARTVSCRIAAAS